MIWFESRNVCTETVCMSVCCELRNASIASMESSLSVAIDTARFIVSVFC